MDTFAALALATEPPVNSLLDRKPYGRKEGLVNFNMTIMLVTQSIYQLIVLFIIYYVCETVGFTKSTDQNNTLIFNCFVFMQIFNEVNARKINNGKYMASNNFRT